MLCCILIALFAPLGISVAVRRGQPARADCCRAAVPWRAIGLTMLGAGLLCAAIFAIPQSRAAFRTWPICTMFGLQAAKAS